MLVTLFGKECKMTLKSLAFYIFLLIFLMHMTTQMNETDIVRKPLPEDLYYGMVETTDEKDYEACALATLVLETQSNNYATYPAGVYKQVVLSEKEQQEVINIIEKCTGKSWAQIMAKEKKFYAEFTDAGIGGAYADDSAYTLYQDGVVDYKTFGVEMEKVCKIVGPGSSYTKNSYESNVEVTMSYEQALEQYNALIEKDGITDAYMRLFCDYAGIVLALLPIFLGVSRCSRDKRAKVDQVIYSKSIKSYQIILSRYLANVVMILLPTVLLALIMEIPYVYQASTLGVKPHLFAFLSYSIVWILPTILFVLAGSFFLTELSNGIVAIVAQVIFAYSSLFSTQGLVGDFRRNLIPRWNKFGVTLQFEQEKVALYQNRILYTVLAILLIAATIFIYNLKRQGGVNGDAKKY